jgi:hypothetical protein
MTDLTGRRGVPDEVVALLLEYHTPEELRWIITEINTRMGWATVWPRVGTIEPETLHELDSK